MSAKALKLIIPILVLIVGVAAAVMIASSRTAPPRAERPPLGPLVEVTPADRSEIEVTVTGHGEVVPKVAVDVVPQVSGKVVRVSRSLVAGGFFRAGETLVVIEPRDYELAVERAQASVERARVTLQREEAEAEVARQEWDQLNPGEEPPSGLVVREPQIRQARAELEAAKADLAVAELNLERTRITVPFDGVVVMENVDPGQFVSMGSRLAQVYGTDSVEVRVPLDSRDIAWFDVPGQNGGPGSSAEIAVEFGGSLSRWPAQISRMEAQIDQSSRMVHVVAEVTNPYGAGDGRPPLLPGSFVDVTIFGRVLDDVVALPRYAIHEGNQVWVFNDGVMEIREVTVIRAEREQALISEGLAAGDLVILTSLDAVTDGMALRLADEEAGGKQPPSATAGENDHQVELRPAIRDERMAGGAA